MKPVSTMLPCLRTFPKVARPSRSGRVACLRAGTYRQAACVLNITCRILVLHCADSYKKSGMHPNRNVNPLPSLNAT
uniref:Uncharacterized protein n=1 Tax=Kuenenia stuttgartiensis TaxID=174633 RepID=Q1PVB2_KUEST|nr:unknown protein [Candidatus Kuenenia stuttgartiensis]